MKQWNLLFLFTGIYAGLTLTRAVYLFLGQSSFFFLIHGIGAILLTIGILLQMAVDFRKKSLLLIPTAFLIGLSAELVGVKYGFLFGSYYYNPQVMREPYIFGLVPLSIPLFWVVLSYIAFSTTNLFFSGRKIPVYLKSLIAAFILLGFDLLLDPVATKLKAWVWLEENNLYYGVPFTNFLGWFLVGFLISLSYGLILKNYGHKPSFLPTICFSILIINNLLEALYVSYFEIAVISALIGALLLLGQCTLRE